MPGASPATFVPLSATTPLAPVEKAVPLVAGADRPLERPAVADSTPCSYTPVQWICCRLETAPPDGRLCVMASVSDVTSTTERARLAVTPAARAHVGKETVMVTGPRAMPGAVEKTASVALTAPAEAEKSVRESVVITCDEPSAKRTVALREALVGMLTGAAVAAAP